MKNKAYATQETVQEGPFRRVVSVSVERVRLPAKWRKERVEPEAPKQAAGDTQSVAVERVRQAFETLLSRSF